MMIMVTASVVDSVVAAMSVVDGIDQRAQADEELAVEAPLRQPAAANQSIPQPAKFTATKATRKGSALSTLACISGMWR